MPSLMLALGAKKVSAPFEVVHASHTFSIVALTAASF
jgi:hypothetical protein